MPGFIAGVKKASEIALSHIKQGPNLGRKFIHESSSLNPDTKRLLVNTIGGAGVGATIGGVTGGVDRDRRVIPGIIGGAFWGAAAGVASVGARRHISGLRKARMKMPKSDQAGRASLMAAINQRKIFTNPRINAAALTGAYGAFGFMKGDTRRKKHYTQFHHGETGRR